MHSPPGVQHQGRRLMPEGMHIAWQCALELHRRGIGPSQLTCASPADVASPAAAASVAGDTTGRSSAAASGPASRAVTASGSSGRSVAENASGSSPASAQTHAPRVPSALQTWTPLTWAAGHTQAEVVPGVQSRGASVGDEQAARSRARATRIAPEYDGQPASIQVNEAAGHTRFRMGAGRSHTCRRAKSSSPGTIGARTRSWVRWFRRSTEPCAPIVQTLAPLAAPRPRPVAVPEWRGARRNFVEHPLGCDHAPREPGRLSRPYSASPRPLRPTRCPGSPTHVRPGSYAPPPVRRLARPHGVGLHLRVREFAPHWPAPLSLVPPRPAPPPRGARTLDLRELQRGDSPRRRTPPTTPAETGR